MSNTFQNRRQTKSLADQIMALELQVLHRQQAVHVRGDTLHRKIRQQISAPTTLLWAGGIGFVFGELTKRHPLKSSDSADKSKMAETSPLKVALNLITKARTLYMALPIAWMLKATKQPKESTGRQYRRGQSLPLTQTIFVTR
jgi:hypothetical protein